MSEQEQAGAASGADTTATTTAETTGAASQGGSSDSGATQTTGGPPLAGAGADTTTTATAEPTWRHRLAGEDKDYLKTLERYADEAAFGRAHRELQRKMSSGEYKAAPSPFPSDGTDEQKAAWRELNGIPPDEKGYEIKLTNGLVLGDADKPGAERLAKFAHGRNWSVDQYNQVLEAYYHEMDAAKAARETADADYHDTAMEALRTDWAGDFKRNLQAANTIINAAPKDVKDRLFGGRTADGRRIADDPAVIKWLAQTQLDLNPAQAVLPAGSANAQGLAARKDALKSMIADRSSEYYKGPNADKLQQEYRDLLSAEERIKGRAA